MISGTAIFFFEVRQEFLSSFVSLLFLYHPPLPRAAIRFLMRLQGSSRVVSLSRRMTVKVASSQSGLSQFLVNLLTAYFIVVFRTFSSAVDSHSVICAFHEP